MSLKKSGAKMSHRFCYFLTFLEIKVRKGSLFEIDKPVNDWYNDRV